MALAVRVPRKDAESVRSELMSRGYLDGRFRLRTEGDHVLIPVSGPVDGFAAEEADLHRIERRETDYRRILALDGDLAEMLPSSFDVIGDVAVIKVPDGLLHLRREIGAAIMETAGVRTVALDRGVKGDLRIRELETVAGSGGTETVHREFGVRMVTDPSKVYFNPRLATERMRIASMVADGETVVDMFAGVAPFPLVIAKHASPKVIYAMDLNPDAKTFMDRNVRLNKVSNIVTMQGDARDLLGKIPRADRMIMNLPRSAMDFLPDALRAAKPGGTIYMHRIMERGADHDDIIRIAEREGHTVEIGGRTELKTYSPSMSVFVFDILIS